MYCYLILSMFVLHFNVGDVGSVILYSAFNVLLNTYIYLTMLVSLSDVHVVHDNVCEDFIKT